MVIVALKKGLQIQDAFVRSQSCSIHKSSDSASFRKAAYRFFRNTKVSEESLIHQLEDQCMLNAKGKRVLVFCDSTSFNIDNHKNRITDFNGLGSIGSVNGKHHLGFLCHSLLVHEQETGIPLGLSSVKLWSRPTQAKRLKPKRYQTKNIAIEEKESYKWLEPCIRNKQGSLKDAAHITFVMDREGDIMEVYDRIPDGGTDVVVRAMHNRNVLSVTGEKDKLYDIISRQAVQYTDTIQIPASSGRRQRKAKVEIRASKCILQWHKRQKVSYKNHPSGVEVSVIEIREKQHNGYPDEPRLIWRLISSNKCVNKQEIQEVIRVYTQRWKVEEFFKFMKSDGFNIESTELESGSSIRKLSLILMQASIKIQQLKAARSGSTSLKTAEVFTSEEVECLELLNEQLEGATKKQKNPYEKQNLAWATWVIARLGGWKEFYNKARPPGHKTLVWGLEKFEGVFIGYVISKNRDVYQR